MFSESCFRYFGITDPTFLGITDQTFLGITDQTFWGITDPTFLGITDPTFLGITDPTPDPSPTREGSCCRLLLRCGLRRHSPPFKGRGRGWGL